MKTLTPQAFSGISLTIFLKTNKPRSGLHQVESKARQELHEPGLIQLSPNKVDKMKKMMMFLMISLCITGTAMAAKKRKGVDADKLPYGSAGCGLGSQLIGSGDDFSQWFASSTNQSSGQVFAITSGTSNCVAVNEMDTAQLREWMPGFVAYNRAQLAEDLARGEGETVRAISSILDCGNPGAVGAVLKKNYGTIFKTIDAQTTSDRLFEVLGTETKNSTNCKKAV
ncbi:MAG: hypothetical protein RJB38_2162 [Pseudomonadota bacterium]